MDIKAFVSVFLAALLAMYVFRFLDELKAQEKQNTAAFADVHQPSMPPVFGDVNEYLRFNYPNA